MKEELKIDKKHISLFRSEKRKGREMQKFHIPPKIVIGFV